MTSHVYKDMMFSPDDFAHLKIPLEDILSATNNFHKDKLLGTGGIGNSHHGQLLWSGESIAICAQRLNKDLRDGEQLFWNEISTLSSLKHKNLVSLVGFCDENDEKIIITRYVVEGSLDNHLSLVGYLTWVGRLEISVDLANALSYIHYDEPRDFSVIHRGIHGGAVLLNNKDISNAIEKVKWEAKLGDFEHSMKIKASQRHHSFYTNTTIHLRGYADPTYKETKSVNHKSDIYSFGIVLLELLCGRESIIDSRGYNQLVPLAITLYREKKLINIIDRELLKQMDLHSFNMFADIVYECLDEGPSRRPNIDDIVPRLEKALELQLKQQNYDNNSIVEGTSSSSSSSTPDDFAHLKIPLEDILSATDNFHEENLVGTGGIGNSHIGQLLWSGESIAVSARRLNKDLRDGEQMFWMEISMLSSLKHKNLVSLVGFCDENDEKIIITRRVVDGSLDNYLSDTTFPTWVGRLEISVGLANALSYIHYDELRDFSVIHRGIHGGAVLLNTVDTDTAIDKVKWEAKLGDFEHSMKIKASQRHHSFYTNTAIHLRGYADPTYKETKSVNHKSDIYSFGIVLLELLCGRESIIDNRGYNQLVPLAITLYREKKLINIIDRELLKQMDLHSFNMFAEIVYECLDNERSRRPNIDDIVPRLEKALELQLKPQNYDNNSIVEGTSSSSIQKKFQHLKIELQAIKSATNEFDDSHCIGKGGFGEVYRGELIHSKGQSVVALKRLNRRFGQGDIEFWKEVIMLSSYRHNNIVSLLGFCDDCGEKILIYEYASRKSLDLYLNNKDLTWVQRLEICIGAARGLAYLHDPGQTQQRLLHRDIKSSNILLDENWNARIADFGLSKFGPANQQYTFLVSHAVGTVGYCDPLYGETGLLTKESDVYSFGVVLFEMLCGRLCFVSEPLIGLVRKCYKQKTIDDIIFGNIKDEINPHSLKAFTTIAYQCLNREQEQRHQ